MSSEKESMSWASLQQQIHEMRAETEAWVAKNQALKAERNASQERSIRLKKRSNWKELIANFLAKIKFASKIR